MWSTRFKAALVSKKVDDLSRLIDEMPSFETPEEMKEAAYLLAEAHNLFESLKRDNIRQREQLKKSIDYLKSTQNPKTAKLDLSF